MNLYIAEPSEIVRSQLRDEEHLNYLELAISTTIRQLFGRSGLALTSKWNSLFAKAVYYTITTGMGVQTLGEEYLGLIQMDGSSSRFVASDLKRFLFIIIECIQNIILHNICKKLSWCGKKLRESNHINPALYVISQELPSMSDALIEYLKAFNIAVFYIFGTPYHQISKAITDIQYRSVRSQSNTEAQKLYRVLGILSLIRLLVIGRRRINHYLQEAGTSRLTAECEFEYSNINQTNLITCPLCYERSLPVCTPCGHTYCWNCIERTSEAIGTKGVLQCPSCRFQFINSRSIPLMNL